MHRGRDVSASRRATLIPAMTISSRMVQPTSATIAATVENGTSLLSASVCRIPWNGPTNQALTE